MVDIQEGQDWSHSFSFRFEENKMFLCVCVCVCVCGASNTSFIEVTPATDAVPKPGMYSIFCARISSERQHLAMWQSSTVESMPYLVRCWRHFCELIPGVGIRPASFELRPRSREVVQPDQAVILLSAITNGWCAAELLNSIPGNYFLKWNILYLFVPSVRIFFYLRWNRFTFCAS